MNEKISNDLKKLPSSPGVYVMYDKSGTVIYVGKAKNLKNRISQYFHKSLKPLKVQNMADSVDYFEYFITLNESDAFALENNLIKKYQPHYNILLKDGKQYPYIKIDLKQDYPKLEIARRVKNDGAKYFGPYIGGINVHEIIKIISTAFGIRTCNYKFSNGKQLHRECLNYSLGLCDAPCTNKISKENYDKNIKRAISFLSGNDEELEAVLNEKMLKSAEDENFEQAIMYRDQLKMIQSLKRKVIANLTKEVDKDIFAYETNNISSVVCSMIVRGGKILGVVNYPFENADISENEALLTFLSQYYDRMTPPAEIILSHKINSSLLSCNFTRKVNFISNPKGINLSLLNMAKKNAVDYLEKHIKSSQIKYNNTIGALKRLQEKLNLENFPHRMECYDISHIQGTNKVASMVVFINGQASKKDYRKFKIKNVIGSDDFACLKETLNRRLCRLAKKDGESFKDKPDLIVIDGGKGQLSATYEILKQYDFKIDIISLAKREEEVFLLNESEPTHLKYSSVELKLLQRIRDEAHRFAITFHRQVRIKEQTSLEIEKIPGLGKVKIQALLSAFKTTENIAHASISSLETVKGINPALATKIYNFFHDEKK